MFTGIIEELGTIQAIKTVKDSQQLTIGCKHILTDVKLGDSIAVNGVCLTVTKFDINSFNVDVMPETYHNTSLAHITINSQVNLERALAIGGRLGGHFVSGHVDGIGKIIAISPNNNAINYEIALHDNLLKYCLPKGSIAIDGTSLTIFAVNDNSIRLSLIPHTIANTILGQKKVGDIVNIENDMLGKYVVNLIEQPSQTNITHDFLQQQGFI